MILVIFSTGFTKKIEKPVKQTAWCKPIGSLMSVIFYLSTCVFLDVFHLFRILSYGFGCRRDTTAVLHRVGVSTRLNDAEYSLL